MNRFRAFVIICAVFWAWLSPELEASGRLGFGVQGGLALTNHWSTKEKSGNYTVSSGIKPGFAAGVLATLRISRLVPDHLRARVPLWRYQGNL